MKRIVALLLIVVALTGPFASAESLFVPEMQRALVSTEYLNQVALYISAYVDRVNAGEQLKVAECELIVDYFRVWCLASNITLIELGLLKGGELLPEVKTSIEASQVLEDYVVPLKDAYLNGEATWENSMAKAIDVIAATVAQ